MPIAALIIVVLLIIVAYMLSGTVAGMGYANLVGDQWKLVDTGWAGALGYGGWWMAMGVALGVLAGFVSGAQVWRIYENRSDNELAKLKRMAAQELEMIQSERAALLKERIDNSNFIQTKVNQVVEQSRLDMAVLQRLVAQAQEAEHKALNRVKSIESRLVASQAKGARLKQSKAKLMRLDEPKPH